MKTRKLSALFLTFILSLSMIFSCGSQDTNTSAGPDKVSTESTDNKETTPEDTGNQEASDKEDSKEPSSDNGDSKESEPSGFDPAEQFLEKEEGMNQLTLYWNKEGADITTSDVWMWWDNKDGQGYLFTPCAYGFKCQVNVPEEVREVGFIVRTNCSDPGGTSWGDAVKDYDGDRFVPIREKENFVYLKSGDKGVYYSDDDGKTLFEEKTFDMAGIISETEIQYFINPAYRIEDLSDVKVYLGDREVTVSSLSSLNNEVITGVITLNEPLDITKNYEVEIKGYGKVRVRPTKIFDTDAFIEKYTYDGDDLGAVIREDGTTVFKVWAPTASGVTLNLFKDGDGGEAYESLPMEKQDKGIYSLKADCGHGTYYTYTVFTGGGAQEAVDPYAHAVGVNGNRGMVVDLKKTDPAGFENDKFVENIETYRDASVWEVHVRDFSNRLSDAKYPGKYLAFTETGLKNAWGVPAGLDYVKDLGITHIHLQPVYDFATVDESSDKPQFNWGYDPKNYNVPEGSYSTDPFKGEVRIREFKQMIAAMHQNNIGMVMDCVYNHTYDANSNLNKIVPYYYYRYNPDGTDSNGSGCGNETASERTMFRKYMIDSVTYWAEEYHVDGFRFDLMGLHDLDTMQAIEQAVHKINPKALIYGEGWTGGTSPLNANKQATLANIRKITKTEGAAGGIAVFNDAIRDGLKGSVFDDKDTGYINGRPTKETGNKVAFGIAGGKKSPGASWSVEDGMVMNYMSCHDNLTLWDKLTISCPAAEEEDLIRMDRLGAGIVLLSEGTPFFLAGEEFFRTKNGDHNSYASSDEINNLDWDLLEPDSEALKTAEMYKEILNLRKDHDFLTKADVTAEVTAEGLIRAEYRMDDVVKAVLVVNPMEVPVPTNLSEEYSLLYGDGTQESVSPWSLGLYVKERH